MFQSVGKRIGMKTTTGCKSSRILWSDRGQIEAMVFFCGRTMGKW